MTTVSQRIKNLCNSATNKILRFNLFDSDRSRSNNFYLRSAIISTRIYIILFILILTILIIYSALDYQTGSITVKKPSQMIFEDLYEKYSTTLSCRCQQTAIPFGSFMSVSVKHHPICSSFFISNEWISQLFNTNIGYYIQTDFRSSASGHFQLLSSFCSLTNQTIRNAIDDLLSSTLITVNSISRQSLKIQTESQSTFVRTSSADTIRRLVKLIQDTTHNNHLQPALQTNGINTLYIYPDGQLASGIYDGCFIQMDGSECCCSTHRCLAPAGFFDLYTYDTYGIYVSPNLSLVNISGFMVGCYAIESILQSTLECLFDQLCVNNLLRFFPTQTNTTHINIIDVNQTKFSPTILIETLVNELFIEEWFTTSSFTAYYNQCAPISCTYTFVQQNHILYVLMALLGLFGGSTAILRRCVPSVIHWCRKRPHQSTMINAPISLRVSVPIIWHRMKMNIIYLNLYKTHVRRTNTYNLTTAIIATRIYLLLLGLSTITLIIFTSLSMQIHHVIIKNPSQETYEQLYNKYPTTLHCPCHQIAITYGSFISLSPKYHPVCSSPYITVKWIDSIVGTVNLNFTYNHDDFHVVGQAFFSTLSQLCSFSRSTLSDAWLIFNHSTLITNHVLSENELISRTDSILDQFESTTINEFKSLLSLIRLHTKTMFTTKRSNADLYSRQFMIMNDTQPKERIDFNAIAARYADCICALTDECKQQVAMYSNGNRDSYELKFYIPNFFIGCFPIQSVLLSSLECFFNQTCLNDVQNEIISNRSINISILQANNTRFLPETLISTLIDSLMIEDWGQTIHYDQYYKECAPKLCSYTTFSRKPVLYIVTKLISLIGGLTVSLKIFVFRIIRWIRNRMLLIIAINRSRDRIRFRCCRFKNYLLQLNIFTRRVTVDAHRYYAGVIATRIYFLLIIIAITILLIYTSVELRVEHIIVRKPSLVKFEQLQSNPRYLSTLECSCHYISVPYSTFMSILPQWHQLCLSDFMDVNVPWLSLIYSPTASLEYPYDDFRLFIVPEFQSLSTLCTLANETFTNALTLFMSNTLTSIHVQTRRTIEKHANESLYRFRSSIPRTFVHMLDYVRHITQGNGIVSSIMSNWHFIALNTSESWDSLWSEPRSYNNCSCGINARCTSPAFINEWHVPGFLVGCYPLEALLQSTLECLYDIICVDKLKTMYYDMNITIRTLDSSVSTPNETVQSLGNRLLIDQWDMNVSYEQYYTACEPLSCTYSIIERANIAYIISTIFSLLGGLSVVLKVLFSIILRIGHYFIRRRRHRHMQPTISVIAVRQ